MSPAKDTNMNNAQLKRERDSPPTTSARPVCIEYTADHDDAIILKRNRKRPRPSLEVPPAVVPDGPIPSLNSLHNSSSCPPSLECMGTTPPEPVKASSSLEISKQLILLNTEPVNSFAPESPVRSIVSCDGDASDDVSTKSDDHIEMKCDVEEVDHHQDIVVDETVTDCFVPPASPTLSSVSTNLDFLHHHVRALRIEASLLPMKTLISRLMSNCTYNRKGVFNAPVDHVALGLSDYTTIIKQPMDLGTIKARVHANSYTTQEEVARDIRLVFHNALLYNPPNHPVHNAASNLLQLFEDGYTSIVNRKLEEDQLTSTTAVTTTAAPKARHTCQSCLGRQCGICKQGCLSLEASLLICAGPACAGSCIRRGSQYFCAVDGSKTWCPRCYSNLPAILPSDDGEDTPNEARYKRQLIKRRNDEDVVERWVTCVHCEKGFHEMCVFSNEFGCDKDNYICPFCTKSNELVSNVNNVDPTSSSSIQCVSEPSSSSVYTFITGEEVPRLMDCKLGGTCFDSNKLPQCRISKFTEEKVKQTMVDLNCPKDSEKTICVRIVSDCDRTFNVPDVVRRHFQVQTQQSDKDGNKVCNYDPEDSYTPPSQAHYRSKTISLFQKVDGIDVCCFCMYVQEYDEPKERSSDSTQKKRVYIAYLDSVEHFRPRNLRTQVYHEILISYIATARARGFEYAHIWSCPPTRGNTFVFWSKPSSQLTPNREHLLSWYHRALSRSVQKGIITDIKSLYEFSFQRNVEKAKTLPGARQDISDADQLTPCPPLLDGDFWIDEAVRVHTASFNRFLKRTSEAQIADDKRHSGDQMFLPTSESRCPTIQMAALLRECIMTHKSASPFCRPVNAAALKLLDYHTIIKKPMDLGTIHSRCLLGEYDTFYEVISDLSLVFDNAKRYNPKGHIVNTMADELWKFTQKELNAIAVYWSSFGVRTNVTAHSSSASYESYGHVSMRLSNRLNYIPENKHCNTSTSHNNVSIGSTQDTLHVVSSEPHLPTNDDTLDLPHGNTAEGETNRLQSSKSKNDFLPGDVNAIAKCMVGEDVWLLDKRHYTKKQKSKKKVDEPSTKKRKESWLGDEVGAAVRRMRTDFFVCYLKPKESMSEEELSKNDAFSDYISSFQSYATDKSEYDLGQTNIADTRHGLLEFLQFRNFQFDTIRRAKYSTTMLLYYLQRPHASGLMPVCTSCDKTISSVRWHRVNKAFDERRRNSLQLRSTCVAMDRKELCTHCFSQTDEKDKPHFVPIRVCNS